MRGGRRETDHGNINTVSFHNVDEVVHRRISLMNRYLIVSDVSRANRAMLMGHTCALLILYSLMTDLMAAGVSSVRGTELVMRIPPFSFFEILILGGFLLSRIPKPSNSLVRIAKSTNGFKTSKTIKMRLQVLATAMT